VAAAVAGRCARATVDQVAADSGGAGLAVGEAGQGSGGAQHVYARSRRRSARPRSAGKNPDGRCASGPSVQSAKTCSTTAWFAVLLLGLDQLERGIGKDRVVAPGGGTARPARRAACLFQVTDPAHDQPRG